MSPSQHIKYGVVDTGNFCGDLERWDALYCAGRLHKPVTHLLPLPARVAAAQACIGHQHAVAGLGVSTAKVQRIVRDHNV